MPTGTVKLFRSSKGYGFIRQDCGGKDVFVHISAVQTAGLNGLRKGQRVSFEIFDNQGKPAAKYLRIDSRPGEAPASRPISDEMAQEAQVVMGRKSDAKPVDDRTPVTRTALEHWLGDALRTSHAEFEPFVGVVVERVVPESSGSPNWAIKGIKYGRANRDRCGAVLSHCVEEAQQEFVLSD